MYNEDEEYMPMDRGLSFNVMIRSGMPYDIIQEDERERLESNLNGL